MPQTTIKYPAPEQDGRRRLTERDKEEIRAKYKPRIYSYAMLAKEYSVSKRLIIFTVNPHKLLDFQRGRQGAWIKYYSTEERKITMRKYRAKKRALGLIAKVTPKTT